MEPARPVGAVSRFLVTRRQDVPSLAAVKSHLGYSEHLRVDFWFSCGYCTIAETEARGITFEIDHYHPESAGGSSEYSNLM